MKSLLEQLGASFALIGGHALVLRGLPRMTVGYDLLTTDGRVLEREVWSCTKSMDGSIRSVLMRSRRGI